ncbi:mechanosensitive ion channel protein [Pedobacter antarcticus 4BY]|uniref:Mechanosensitive ion channel protein n=2 Tax=Pedobacter antarcticus TaxID=34086 RepID=A0A081PBJ8_9SPHI|nr:mechanosensitive ion channel domain-containing protein [Pedobacter antarcticus]KEQ28071.1 mechanosensitive ion channel protein [Pedobacter antarcticus 4BY]SFE40851.1 Small-conductance mechanosensitive channel [Pedobacter antarcticus]
MSERRLRSPYSFFLLLTILLSLNFSEVFGQIQLLPVRDTLPASQDTVLYQIQKAQATLDEVNINNQKGFNIARIRSGLEEMEQNLEPLEADLETKDKTLDMKSLQSYGLILKDSRAKLMDWQSFLASHHHDLLAQQLRLKTFSKDSTLAQYDGDSSYRQLYATQIVDVRGKLALGLITVATELDSVSTLLADVSASSSRVNNLQAMLDEQLKISGKSQLGKESPYIWSAPRVAEDISIKDLLNSTFQGQNKILKYFIRSTWDNRILLLLISVAFFVWVYRNLKKVSSPELKEAVGEVNLLYLNRYPILASLIFLFNLTPLFEPESPAFYIELNQFFLLLVLTAYFWKKVKPEELKHWLLSVVLYMIVILTTVVVHSAIWMRLWLLILNLGSLYLGVVFYRRLQRANFDQKLVRPVLIIYLIFNVLSVLLNVFGRVSLAKAYSITAIIGLTQVIGLAVFIQVVIEAIEIQIRISACSNGLFSRINIAKSRATFYKLLTGLAILLWMLVFLINLGIASGVYNFIEQVLTKSRSFGSISYQLSNVLYFVIIIYISNLLQKYVGLLWSGNNLTFAGKTEPKSSKLALFRLLIIVIGFLFAVMASGIPVDKLTVMLGAFGVGVGLGMQNIINNFVSGIILIFEKPFRIGDYIELAEKKGKIQDIGIRSSKMLTAQGSEVIIPNGDLLSGRVVNWTLSNDYLKTELLFKVSNETDLDMLRKLIESEVKKSTVIVKRLAPEVLVNAITADAVELKVMVWVNSVYQEANFKSQLFTALLAQFKTLGIKIL